MSESDDWTEENEWVCDCFEAAVSKMKTAIINGTLAAWDTWISKRYDDVLELKGADALTSSNISLILRVCSNIMAVDVDHSGHENTIIELRELLDPDTEYNDYGSGDSSGEEGDDEGDGSD